MRVILKLEGIQKSYSKFEEVLESYSELQTPLLSQMEGRITI